MNITANFDWSITQRKLCIFIPNFGKTEQLDFAISQIKTRVPKKDWIVIIGNDGIDIDFNYMKSSNVRYFTLHRDPVSRNGGFIRNYFIKRCQSEKLLQKDPEIVLQGDFIYQVIRSEASWRAGNVYVLDRAMTSELIAEKDFGILKYSACIKIDPVQVMDSKHAKYLIAGENGRVNFSSYFHYAYAIKTKILQKMQGYDERYTHYGYEDSDMFCRLLQLKHYLVPDYATTAIHLYHDRDPGFSVDDLKVMRKIFDMQNPVNTSRNRSWGEG